MFIQKENLITGECYKCFYWNISKNKSVYFIFSHLKINENKIFYLESLMINIDIEIRKDKDYLSNPLYTNYITECDEKDIEFMLSKGFTQIKQKEEKNKMSKIKEILEGVYNNHKLRKSVVPLFISHPGMGKTAQIEQFAKEKKATLVEIITSQVSPYEVSGICIPSHTKEKMVYYDFDRIDNLKDGDILFFDELLAGNPVVLSACLTLIEQRRTISGKNLPNIMIVAAANPQGQVPLTPAIKERFIWYNIDFDPISWKEYIIKRYDVTNSIANNLANLIKKETFDAKDTKSVNNFNSARSITKAINMIINKVPTPYEKRLLPFLNETITNPLEEEVDLGDGKTLSPGQVMPWLELIRIKNNIK